MTTTGSDLLLRGIRWLLAFFIRGLALSGVTAIPIETELNWLVNLTGARTLVESSGTSPPVWAEWLCRVQAALQDTMVKATLDTPARGRGSISSPERGRCSAESPRGKSR
jgi:hypothetical protein